MRFEVLTQCLWRVGINSSQLVAFVIWRPLLPVNQDLLDGWILMEYKFDTLSKAAFRVAQWDSRQHQLPNRRLKNLLIGVQLQLPLFLTKVQSTAAPESRRQFRTLWPQLLLGKLTSMGNTLLAHNSVSEMSGTGLRDGSFGEVVKSVCLYGQVGNKLASLEATLVWNYDRPTESVTDKGKV